MLNEKTADGKKWEKIVGGKEVGERLLTERKWEKILLTERKWEKTVDGNEVEKCFMLFREKK